jgi:isopentenyl phosphate kinase
MSKRLVFLKLGGSLITDKNVPYTPRPDALARLAKEISEACGQDRDLQILLGHGSGSFGHVPASRYHTRRGVRTPQEWNGFVEVWQQAAELNHLVLSALLDAKLPALALPPSASVIANEGRIVQWQLEPLRLALKHGLLPVVQGDVVFDIRRGGTILSTEDLFAYLTRQLLPAQILLAGREAGVWQDFPQNTRLLTEITPDSFPTITTGLAGSTSTDVTGGMIEKVRLMLSLVEEFAGVRALIFSGEAAGNVRRALLGENIGTLIQGS